MTEADRKAGPVGWMNQEGLLSSAPGGGYDTPLYIEAALDAALAHERATHPQAVAAPSLDRIDEAHSYMPLTACEHGADHGEALGLKHRAYAQRGDEACFICTLLSERASAIREAVEADREEWRMGQDNDRQVCFYERDFYVLSNFSAFNLEWRGLTFHTSEAAYHWEKFITAEDDDTRNGVANAIFEAPSAHAAFKIAEAQKHLRRADWDDIKLDVMRRILTAKAEQHEYVRRKLLATGDRELIEDSWRDDYWGWGPNRDGKNMLGKLWMEVRAAIRSRTHVARTEKGLT